MTCFSDDFESVLQKYSEIYMNKRCDKDVADVHVAPFRISTTMTKLVYCLFNIWLLG